MKFLLRLTAALVGILIAQPFIHLTGRDTSSIAAGVFLGLFVVGPSWGRWAAAVGHERGVAALARPLRPVLRAGDAARALKLVDAVLEE